MINTITIFFLKDNIMNSITETGKFLVFDTLNKAEIADMKVFENYVRYNAKKLHHNKMYNFEDKKWSDEWRVSSFTKGKYKVVGLRDNKDNLESGFTESYAEISASDTLPTVWYFPKPDDSLMNEVVEFEVYDEGQLAGIMIGDSIIKDSAI